MKVVIGWLYPELMNTYGDRGNILCLRRRCEWRGIEVKVNYLDTDRWDLRQKPDILFMGGAQDRQQEIVAEDLQGEKKQRLKEMIESGTVGLFICGAYQFLGKYYKTADEVEIPGLGIMDHYTVHPGKNKKRLIGNVAVRLELNSDLKDLIIAGFENHGGRTYLGSKIKPLGEVISGFGNNGEDGSEGAIYKNSICTYLHGSVLPKNPKLADFIVKKALEIRYNKGVQLEPLDDDLENKARSLVLKRLHIKP